eukprot:TRINITY_DN31587_c0_g1_i1.p1 TRINITY_DN31587_c0_g1~~TRINITY_DN31587_c0_g1_i1.p1  ORF type:complete len:600 (+),score=146.11 TRINITY_DN31587_c0_g1_i1:220-2019(+)
MTANLPSQQQRPTLLKRLHGNGEQSSGPVKFKVKNTFVETDDEVTVDASPAHHRRRNTCPDDMCFRADEEFAELAGASIEDSRPEVQQLSFDQISDQIFVKNTFIDAPGDWTPVVHHRNLTCPQNFIQEASDESEEECSASWPNAIGSAPRMTDASQRLSRFGSLDMNTGRDWTRRASISDLQEGSPMQRGRRGTEDLREEMFGRIPFADELSYPPSQAGQRLSENSAVPPQKLALPINLSEAVQSSVNPGSPSSVASSSPMSPTFAPLSPQLGQAASPQTACPPGYVPLAAVQQAMAAAAMPYGFALPNPLQQAAMSAAMASAWSMGSMGWQAHVPCTVPPGMASPVLPTPFGAVLGCTHPAASLPGDTSPSGCLQCPACSFPMGQSLQSPQSPQNLQNLQGMPHLAAPEAGPQEELAANAVLPLHATSSIGSPHGSKHAPQRPSAPRRLRLWAHIYLHMQAEGFDLVPRFIGRGGCNTRKIAEATGAKVRIRGQGSGHKEVEGKHEAPTPLMVAVTTDEAEAAMFKKAVDMTVKVLKTVEGRYLAFCQQKKLEHSGPCYSIGLLNSSSNEALGSLLDSIPQVVSRSAGNALDLSDRH